MSTTLYLVSSGGCSPLTAESAALLADDRLHGYDRSRGGVDWLLVLASSEDDAVSQATAWDAVPETNGEALVRHASRVLDLATTLQQEGRRREADWLRALDDAQAGR
jgi:hypothetical protein